jgi:hypothetical protein
LKKSQVFLSSINELHDGQKPYDIEYWSLMLEKERAYDAFLTADLRHQMLQTNGTVGRMQQRLQAALEA